MSKIKILPENIANKIAAGEVVQRPESVVKELLENSIDAKAKNVDVIVKRAGKSLIQIVDDGEGMSEEDAVLSVQRHATSKISDIDDLERIRTFGFRGEALSSIAAVSQLEIKTEMKNDELGTCIKFEDGEIIKEKGSFSKGTSISVKNLFFNTPARRNFLKSDATELKHIIESFKIISLSHPEVNFKFYNDDDLIFNFEAGDIKERLKSVIAENVFEALVEVKENTEYLSLNGYIAKPNYLRKSKGEQYLFINKRYVNSRQINHSIFNAYENMIEKGDYPFFALFLDIDPKHIDINVHPQKLEVKFEDERNIYNFVNAVIKKSLGSYDLVPNVTFNSTNESGEKISFNRTQISGKDNFSDRPDFSRSNNYQPESRRNINYTPNDIDLLFSSINSEIKNNAPGSEIPHPFQDTENREVYHDKAAGNQISENKIDSLFIVQLHNKYILSQIKSGLMIIDQHVAHERILYEKALKSFNADMPFSQQLLFSQTLSVDPGDYGLLKELQPYLLKLGFEIKFFSKNTVVIDGVPQDVKIGTEEQILLEILHEYKTNRREKQLEERDNLAKSFSCKAAIKAGDKLSDKEMRILVDQLFATSTPYVCPHGRPIIIKIPLDEFDRRFGRTS